MGDLRSGFAQAWSDEDQARATGLVCIVSPDGKTAGPVPAAVERAKLKELYREVRRIRALGQQARALAEQGRLGLSPETLGREVAIVGAAAAMAAEDPILPGGHEAGAALVRGLPVTALVAQLFGNANDLARGRQVPGCAAVPRALAVFPGTPFAGTQLPQAAGVAWAMKMQHKKGAVLAFLDGAETSSEDFHAGLNFAGVYKLPVVFVCINDPVRTAAAPETLSETLAIKALAYGLPGVRVDGSDLVAVLAETRAAAERASKGEGATFIEAVINNGDGGDGLDRLATWLATEKLLSAADEAALRAEVEAEVGAAFRDQAKVGPPPRHRIIEDVLARPPAALEEELATLERIRG
jgi:2-oxoisovalerate dehydrogenase E1 component alpha subunit